MRFFGRPPRLPFSRAAEALASERTCPPLRPNSTAAGFLRGTANAQRRVAQRLAFGVGRDGAADIGADLVVTRVAQGLILSDLQAQIVSGETVDLSAGALCLHQQRAEANGIAGKSGAELVWRELREEPCFLSHHGYIIPNRLGFVN